MENDNNTKNLAKLAKLQKQIKIDQEKLKSYIKKFAPPKKKREYAHFPARDNDGKHIRHPGRKGKFAEIDQNKEKGNLTLNDESSVQQDGLMSMINAIVSKSNPLTVHVCCKYQNPTDCLIRKNECCVNYYMVNGQCSKCHRGTYDNNCIHKCPANMYGELCIEKCNCKVHQQCHYIHGCINLRGNCSKNSDELICCTNYILIDGYCKACPLGTFGRNCQDVCPAGFYGLFCEKACNCKASDCDKAVGCLPRESRIKTTGLIYLIIPVVLGTTVVFGCLFRRYSRYKQRNYFDVRTLNPEVHRSPPNIVPFRIVTTTTNENAAKFSESMETSLDISIV